MVKEENMNVREKNVRDLPTRGQKKKQGNRKNKGNGEVCDKGDDMEKGGMTREKKSGKNINVCEK